jgi:hypothetical protein
VVSAAARWMWRRFRARGGLEADEWTRALPFALREWVDSGYVRDLGADICVLAPAISSTRRFAGSVRREQGRLRIDGPFGTLLGLGGIYLDVVRSGARSASELAGFALPAVRRSWFDGIRRFRERNPDVFLLAECVSLAQAVCDYIVGTERFMLALYDYPGEVATFLGRMADWIAEIIAGDAEAGADAVFLQDDCGGMGRTLYSVGMWQELVLPRLRRLAGAAHARGVPLVLHSCGYQMPFLPHYVEAGVDGLQCFQPGAGNDLTQAVARFGDRLAFLTGIDVQRGETMGPEEMASNILEQWKIGRRSKRFILAMTHRLQYTMPLANVAAIFDTVRDIREGRHGGC